MDTDSDDGTDELCTAVRSLYGSYTFSDISIKLKGRKFPGHRIVLHARGGRWGSEQLIGVDYVDLSHLEDDVALSLLKWAYTNEIEGDPSTELLLALMQAGSDLELKLLVEMSGYALQFHVTPQNCIALYAAATNAEARNLQESAGELINQKMPLLRPEAFANIDAKLVCELVVEHSKSPLHRVVTIGRFDVVQALFSIYASETSRWLNSLSDEGCVPLELALNEQLTDIAALLCQKGANPNAKDLSGWTILQQAIRTGNAFAAKFLISNGGDVLSATPRSHDTCLHLVCRRAVANWGPFPNDDSENGEFSDEVDMLEIARLLLQMGADPTKRNTSGFTPLHMVVMEKNMSMLKLLLQHEATNVDVFSNDGIPPLLYALGEGGLPFASLLLEHGARADVIISEGRQSLLQMLVSRSQEMESLFVCERISAAQINHMNIYGETALHIAAMLGLKFLVAKLIEKGADVNIETVAPPSHTFTHDNGTSVAHTGYKRTCLHYAILHIQTEICQILLEQRGSELDCNLKDSMGNTPLSLALKYRPSEYLLSSLFTELMKAGADINLRNGSGLTLLHEAIVNCDTWTALFLVNHGADINALTKCESQHPLQMAIANGLHSVVETLCKKGVDMSVPNKDGYCPLWAALFSGQYDIASILVRNGADTDAWGPGTGGCYQALLHSAIDMSNQDIACFLINNGCDYTATRRPSPEGIEGDKAKDGCIPLHLCCRLGLTRVVIAILEHEDCGINKQDAEGKTPLLTAIESGYQEIIALLLSSPSINVQLKDNRGNAPFEVANKMKNSNAARGILLLCPTAAEQFNNKSFNCLHSALIANNVENALFLLSLNLDVNSRTRDGTESSPLHLAASRGNEVLVRTIILAGALVNCTDANNQTPLHVAALAGHAELIPALIQEGGTVSCKDVYGNTPLHYACKNGHVAVVRALLQEHYVDGDLVNNKEENPLHILARYGKENASTICEILLEYHSFRLDQQDVDGNTALALSYMKGNGALCRVLVKAGASLSCINKENITLFNYEVATSTQQLLYSLLECLDKEPPWSCGDSCLECGVKFGLKVRRHHCRHCGRILCSRCSDQTIAIVKFKLNKPVRVCSICLLVLQGGPS